MTIRTTLGGRRRRSRRALTLLELLVVVLVLGFLFYAVVVPGMFRPRRPALRIQCANNLKQTGLAFRLFAADNSDKFPAMFGTNEGGVKELVNTGPNGTGDPTRTYEVFVHLSNELATPKVLVCPADRARLYRSNFTLLAAVGAQNASLSYFVNLDADELRPMAILAGDRNLSTVSKARKATDYDVFFSVEHRIRPGDVALGFPYAALDFQPSLHYDKASGVRRGNVALSDGSVMASTAVEVRRQVQSGTNDHRLIFPFVPGKNE